MACLRLPLWFHGYIVCRQIRGQFDCLALRAAPTSGDGHSIVRTPGTLAGPYGDLETPVEPDGDARVSEDTRRLRERIAKTSKAVLHSLDELVGAVIGKRLEQVNEACANMLAIPFINFFGDIVAYQRNQGRGPARPKTRR